MALRTMCWWDKQRAAERQGSPASTPFWLLANRNNGEALGFCAHGRVVSVRALAHACAKNAHRLVLCSGAQGEGFGWCVRESQRDALGGEFVNGMCAGLATVNWDAQQGTERCDLWPELIRHNGDKRFPGSEAKQDGVAGLGASTDVLASVRACGQA
jgi:hypothetical protein